MSGFDPNRTLAAHELRPDQHFAYTKSGKLPKDIPVTPSRVYKDKGWINYGDWLGTGFIAARLRKYRPFKRARAFVRKLGLKSVKEWRAYIISGELSEVRY